MDIIDKIENLIESYVLDTVEFKGKKYQRLYNISFDKLEYGKVYLNVYKNGGKIHTQPFKFIGYSDENQRGNSGPKFKNWKEVKDHYKLKKISDYDTNGDYGIRMCGEFDDSNKAGCFYYVSNKSWVRGSGADKLTFIELKEV